MESSQTIDILVPNYNKAKFIEDCFISLLSQSFRNWRCIVVDGFSDDGSWEIIQIFAQKEPRFEIYQIPRKGLYNSWNFGLSKVENPYFCILTSDDTWDKNWLQTAVESLENNLNAVCAAARTRVIDADGQLKLVPVHNLMGEQFFQTSGSNPQIRQGIISSVANYFLGSIYTSIHSLLMRSTILQQGEKFAEDVGNIADYEWYIRMSFYGDIIYHPSIEAYHRIYEGQATSRNQQSDSGTFMQKIHFRNREMIAKKLGTCGNKFISLATQYDKSIIAYHYARPTGKKFVSQPILSLFELLHIFYKMPIQLLKDIFFKITGKNFYIKSSMTTINQLFNNINE